MPDGGDRGFGAFLFDMDGTILSSLAAVERAWAAWGRAQGVDVGRLLRMVHGVPAVDIIRALDLPNVDPEEHAHRIMLRELDDLEDIEEIPGAADFLKRLPAQRWAIVTSAPRPLALARLQAVGMPPPPLLIAAGDASRGKPAPDGFLMAADQLGVDPASCLVFEDAPAGIKAAEAAGASIIVVSALHSRLMRTNHPQMKNFEGIRVAPLPGALWALRGLNICAH